MRITTVYLNLINLIFWPLITFILLRLIDYYLFNNQIDLIGYITTALFLVIVKPPLTVYSEKI